VNPTRKPIEAVGRGAILYSRNITKKVMETKGFVARNLRSWVKQ
jgi:hypothetical protein